MTTVPFDMLKLAERLTGSGFTDAQARGAASALAEAMGGADLVTKEHLDNKLASIQQSLASLEQTLTIKLGRMIIAATGVLTVAIGLAFRLLPPH